MRRSSWLSSGGRGLRRGGLGRSEIHSSLAITLVMLSTGIVLVSFFRDSLLELRTLAISLPVVWVVSLAVRIAAQQLSIGRYSLESTTVVGPSGNLETDYEYLPPRAIFTYSIAGQLVSLALVSLGIVVGAAMSPAGQGQLTWAELLDMRGGWDSRAWATQIMWVNAFLFVLHLLPTVPFDMRATLFAIFNARCRNTHEPAVLRNLATFNSHTAALLFGIGATAAAASLSMQRDIAGWYAVMAAAVYLFVASQWELSRAAELEAEYTASPARRLVNGNLRRRAARQFGAADSSAVGGSPTNSNLDSQRPGDGGAASEGGPADANSDAEGDTIDGLTADAHQSVEHLLDTFDEDDSAVDFGQDQQREQHQGFSEGGYADDSRADSLPDVDQILRKLHREGYDTLTPQEHEALLAASREIKAKRQ